MKVSLLKAVECGVLETSPIEKIINKDDDRLTLADIEDEIIRDELNELTGDADYFTKRAALMLSVARGEISRVEYIKERKKLISE